jgi:23S rRNA G2445 N2-methylase RlmL
MNRPKARRPRYAAQTQPGFEIIAAREIAGLDGAAVRETRQIGDKNGLVLFDFDGDPRALLELRTVEDVFVVVLERRDVPPTYGALRELRDEMQRVPLEAAVALARAVKPGRGGQGKLRFRVVARQLGMAHYRRADAQQYVEKGILARSDRRWRLADENALEFWLTIGHGEALVLLRLSDETLRHRARREHLPASLRPSAAAALVLLTRPRPTDVFLDPMCGAGTILIERGEAGRYRQLLGGDIRPEALATAQANIGPRYQPIALREWDARDLPLDDASVTACAVNLPFGQQLGSPEENRGLYPAVLRELGRVLAPRARLAALTGDTRAFERAAERTPAFAPLESFPVLILGRQARVYVLERR